ncbi:MAG: glycosyltransferase family 2 protein [Bacteroidales bacterium]|jgi:glycosyltransferase involved in cell wall biosynthesis|nr:glycosyltransferase family 2 protein [Bacteroidales bacterium]
MQKISIIVPAYNEGKTIQLVLEKLKNLQLVDNIRKEVIVVNDASKDDTETKVQDFIKAHPAIPSMDIIYLKHEKNAGKGQAIRTAIEHISGEVTIIQDADLETDVEDINLMLTYYLQHNLKVLYGSRFFSRQNIRRRSYFYWGGRLVSLVANILYFQRLSDAPTCYKMIDTALLKSIPLNCSRFEFCPEITAKIAKKGIKIQEYPIRYYPRTIEEGKKLRWHDGIEAIWTLLKYRFVN